jgi:hypothetical protein
MEALSKITTKGLLTFSSIAIKNAKNHNLLTLCHNFAKTSAPDDSRAPMIFSRCPRFAVMAWVSLLFVHAERFGGCGAKPASST